jgi:TonB-dependent receptor
VKTSNPVGSSIKESFCCPLLPITRSAIKFAFLSLTLCASAFSQQFGGIRGQVVDSDFGQPIAKASVTIMGSPFGAVTDDQGNFTISGVPPGVYTIQTRAPSYIPKTVPDISVAAGSFNEMRFEAVAEIEEMEELVVPGEIEKASETGLLAERQSATAVMDMIGQDFISRLGAANAGDAMKRMVGTSVQDGKYVAVRGMPDRYVNTLLNGGRLPSTDPDRRAINVDLFPGTILESINTYKTFTPDQPADFTGGSVDIRTKTFPDKPSFGTGVTVEYNSQTTFNPNFLTYDGGGTGLFGGKANSRAIPDSVINNPVLANYTPYPTYTLPASQETRANATEANNEMKKLNPVVGLKTKAPPPNTSFNLQGGDFVEFSPEEKMGVIGVFSYRNKYSFYDNGIRSNLQLIEVGDTIAPNPDQQTFNQQQGTQEVLWGGLIGLSGEFDKDNQVSMNVMYNLGADDNAVQRSSPGATFTEYNQIIDYGERTLGYLQLLGTHTLQELRNLKISWNGGLGQASLLEPDQRQFSYNLTTDGQYQDPFYNNDSGDVVTAANNETLNRFQRQLNEDSYYSIVDFTIPMLDEKERTDAFKTGFYLDSNSRSYNQASFNYVYGGYSGDAGKNPGKLYAQFPGTYGLTWADVFLQQGLPVSQPTEPGDYGAGLVNVADPTLGNAMTSYMLVNQGFGEQSAGTFYTASQDVTASYLMADFDLFPTLRLTGGTRFENTNLKVRGSNDLPSALFSKADYPEFVGGTGSGLAKIQQLDLLPSVGATFKLIDNVNFRFAWSQTLARPSFKEMGPVLTKDFTDNTFFLGNPNLQLSKANNYDFRTEWFPRAGEVFAISLFYKDLQKPMEQVTFNNATYGLEYFQYQNAPYGTVYGIEIEARKRLDQVASWLKNFSVYFNYTQIQSEVPLTPLTAQAIQIAGETQTTRPLQGQPEYIINTGLSYDNDEYRFYAGVYFNVIGPTLFSAGSASTNEDTGNINGFIPDIYEQPAPSLDFNLTQGITDNWRLTFRGKNLLNPLIQRTQTFNGEEFTFQSYTKGWDISLNAAYSF